MFIQDDFNIESIEVATLTMSLFLVGYIIGPIFFAPTSEFYGRRWVSISSFGWYIIATILCAIAPNIEALLVFRFLAGIGASAPLSVVRDPEMTVVFLDTYTDLLCFRLEVSWQIFGMILFSVVEVGVLANTSPLKPRPADQHSNGNVKSLKSAGLHIQNLYYPDLQL